MTHAVRSLVVVSLLCLQGLAAAQTPQQPPAARRFDFSAVDRLWAIASSLEKDREPPAADWEALVRTEGYAALIAHEPGYGLEFLQRNLRLVFKPSLASELAKAKRSSALAHFLALKEEKAALQAFERQVQQSPAWSEAIQLLQPWLPDKSIQTCAPPAVTFVVFAKDARGGYGPLVFDLLYAYERGETLAPLVAHEMFHYYSRELPAWDPGGVREAHQTIVDALAAIQGEGIADQIDKAAAIETGIVPEAGRGQDYDREYRQQMAESPRILGALDDLLCEVDGSRHEASSIGGRMRAAIPMSGHPTGYFMARAILQHGGKRELVRTSNNPFAFFYLYNAAAAADPTLPRLSNASVNVLRRLERLAGGQPEESLARAALTEGVDWSSVKAFKAISDELAADREPDESVWARLFDTPRYRFLFATGGDHSARDVREALSLAFRPSRKAELDRAIESPSPGLVRYFHQYRQDGDAAAEAWEHWQQSGAFERAVEAVLPWLPPGARDVLAGSTIALTYLGKVDVWYGYEAVLVDPVWILRDGGPASIATFLRRNLLMRYTNAVRTYDEGMLTRREAAFLGAWEQVQRLGLDDLISRESGDSERLPLGGMFDARVKDAAGLVHRADAIMRRARTDRSAWRDFETLQRDFFLGQRSPLGYFMASTCRDVLGREALARTTGNPIAFLQLYQKAAATKGLPVFSKQSLDWLAGLAASVHERGRCEALQSSR